MNPIFHVDDGRYVTFGLRWVLLQGPKAEKLAKARARIDGAAYMSRIEFSEGTYFGLLTDYDREAAGGKLKKGKLLSAAALLSTLPGISSSAIFIHAYKPLGADKRRAAVIVLHDGVVFDDRIDIQLDDLENHIGRARASIADLEGEQQAPSFAIYATDTNLHPDATELPLTQLVNGNADAAALVDARANAGTAMLLVAIVLLLVGWLGWDEWADYQKRQQLTQQPAQQGPTPAQLYQQALDARLRQIGIGPQAFMSAISRPMGESDTPREGYDLRKSTCNGDGVCTEDWDRVAGMGVLDRFIAANEGAQVKPSTDGKGATVSYRVQMPQKAAITRNVLGKAADVDVQMRSLMQRYVDMGIESKLDRPLIFALPNGVQEAVLPAGVAVRYIPVEFSGPLALLPDLLGPDKPEELQFPANLFVDELTFNGLNGPVTSTTFVFKATLYVQ
ncbi:MAG: hypothetical protein ACN6OP_09120 [Pseudomonadales bacterium]